MATKDRKSPNLHFRMREAVFPEDGDLVVATVKRFSSEGVYVFLPEYLVEGMVPIKEASKQRFISLRQVTRVGKLEVLVVIRVDAAKGYVDLSKRRVTVEEEQDVRAEYRKTRLVHSILCQLAMETRTSPQLLYEEFGWAIHRQFGHAYYFFSRAVAPVMPDEQQQSNHGPHLITANPLIPETMREPLLRIAHRHLAPQNVKLRALVDVTCFGRDGIDAIQSSLQSCMEKYGRRPSPIRARECPESQSSRTGGTHRADAAHTSTAHTPSQDTAVADPTSTAAKSLLKHSQLAQSNAIRINVVVCPTFQMELRTLHEQSGRQTMAQCIEHLRERISAYEGGNLVVRQPPHLADRRSNDQVFGNAGFASEPATLTDDDEFHMDTLMHMLRDETPKTLPNASDMEPDDVDTSLAELEGKNVDIGMGIDIG